MPEILKNVGKAITTLPENFKPHKAVKRIYDQRAHMIETGEGITWALGEALAFATLLVEGNHVRLSGQDVERGTFSHRHSVLHDQATGEQYCPLDHIMINQNEEMFTVSNSSLSEFGVLGFELGYSMENPNSLVLWEAQSGDFANGARVIFDQFLSSGESKWLRQTGLVVLLPHGYDGQLLGILVQDLSVFFRAAAAATSCCFLSHCIIAVSVAPSAISSTPLAFTLRCVEWQRSIREEKQKMGGSPSSYHSRLRVSPHTTSPIRANIRRQGHPGFDKQGTRFKRLIKDRNDHSDHEPSIRRLVLCSGKVYYELDELRQGSSIGDVAICRVEQLCPFPYDLIQRELKRYPNAEIMWCQEEPMNMGAYSYIAPRLSTAMKALGRGNIDDIKYVGRAPSAATATGFYSMHGKEQNELVTKALQPEPIVNPH
ncbi:2-oxoglutarate dehydrogenase, mitochondrial-like protein [Drosera capensis]